MKIKEGEYVRTEKGIIGKFKGYSPSLIFAKDDIELDHCTIGFDEDDIKAHSKNIIDLIEVNDYVNGHKVIELFYGEDDNEMYMTLEAPFDERAIYVGEKDIKTIVTREQFNSVMYKVVE